MNNIAVVSERANGIIKALSEELRVIPLPGDGLLDGPVSSHPDMILCRVCKKLFVHKNYYEKNKTVIEQISAAGKLEIATVTGKREKKYPFDISLNALVCGGAVFSLTEYTEKEIIAEAIRNGMKIVRVKQGYTACSTLNVGNLIISSDNSILSAAENSGFDTLGITPGSISLDGYDYGFIGGASGVMGNRVYFTGELNTHPDGKKIRESIYSHGFEIIELTGGNLTDIGGIKFF